MSMAQIETTAKSWAKNLWMKNEKEERKKQLKQTNEHNDDGDDEKKIIGKIESTPMLRWNI